MVILFKKFSFFSENDNSIFNITQTCVTFSLKYFFILLVEELVTSIVTNTTTSQLILKCSLVNSRKLLQFCRFVRLVDDVGFNLEVGQGNGKYR